MPGFFEKNKKYLAILVLFVFLFWLVTIQVRSGRLRFMERPVLAVSGFFERIVTGTYSAIASVGGRYVFLVRTERENRRLKAKIDELRLENSLTNELMRENERFRQLLGFRNLQQKATVAVEVIGEDLSSSSNTVTVNKGSDDGLRRDMAVITPDGVVGRVQTVLGGTSRVQLLTDPGSTIAVRVQRNREEGLLEGKLDRCALKYVSYYLDVQEGDLLVTSGMDGIYPKGLPVATVTLVRKQEASSFQTVYADPVVPISHLENALVLVK